MTAGRLAQLREDLAETRRDLYRDSQWSDSQAHMLEQRVAALEEITAARWPRRVVVRRRLARDLRASVRGYGWVDRSWFWRRAQAIGDGWLDQ